MSNLTFGDALTVIKQGGKVAREGWNGSGMFVYHVPSNVYKTQTPVAKESFGDEIRYSQYLALYNVNKEVAVWTPSTSDVLQEDWYVVE